VSDTGDPLDFEACEALTFDCYGTLIDWEAGIERAVRDLLGEPSDACTADQLLEQFGRFESEAEGGAFRSYREVLQDVARSYGMAHDVDVGAGAVERFAGSVPDWPPFDDTVEALRALGSRYRLAVVSNVDDDLFAGSAARLGIDFDEVVTAQQVRSYKPARAHFDEVLRRLGLPKARVMHVAQSLYHDIAPARELGLRCVWVNRRAGRGGPGATPPARAVPDAEVPDLGALVDLAGLGGS
jgi:2-haloacid dehalogenase